MPSSSLWSRARFLSVATTKTTKRVCIVGSGPSGFYAAKYLNERAPDEHTTIKVDILERLPVPYGLVRYGVAPDHPEVKSVESTFAKLASDPSRHVRFFGNVHVGGDIDDVTAEASPAAAAAPARVTLAALRAVYDAVILAYGASGDKPLGLGEGRYTNIASARQFVNWYNGYPDHSWARDLSAVTDVVIIGNGNVALDCARILSKCPADLAATDITREALEALGKSAVRRVSVVGRRGAAQASFTIKEARELTKISGAQCRILPSELTMSLGAASLQEVAESRPKARIIELLRGIAADTSDSLDTAGSDEETTDAVTAAGKRHIDLRFLLRPAELLPHPSDSTRISAVRMVRTELSGQAHRQAVRDTAPTLNFPCSSPSFSSSSSTHTHTPAPTPTPTLTLPCQLLLTSVGYQSEPMPGAPFNPSSHTVPNSIGRVADSPGLYVVGWLKRGPTGIIASAVTDAKETVHAVLEDMRTGASDQGHLPGGSSDGYGAQESRPDPIDALPALRGPQVVSWEAYQRLDAFEREHGGAKPREKITSVAEMLRRSRS